MMAKLLDCYGNCWEKRFLSVSAHVFLWWRGSRYASTGPTKVGMQWHDVHTVRAFKNKFLRHLTYIFHALALVYRPIYLFLLLKLPLTSKLGWYGIILSLPTLNLRLLPGLHRPGAFNMASLGLANKMWVISSGFTGRRFNHLRAVQTAPSAWSGAQSAGTISEHLDKPPLPSTSHPRRGGQCTLRAAWTGAMADLIVTLQGRNANFSHLCLLTKDVKRIFPFFSVFPPISRAVSIVSPHRECEGAWRHHPLQCQNATKRSGGELACTFCSIKTKLFWRNVTRKKANNKVIWACRSESAGSFQALNQSRTRC